MMFDTFWPPALAGLGIWAAGAFFGMIPMVRIIRMAEAWHELKRGSAGFLRAMGGVSLIVIWLVSLWFAGSVLGDWQVMGDLELALEASALRLRILIEVLLTVLEAQ